MTPLRRATARAGSPLLRVGLGLLVPAAGLAWFALLDDAGRAAMLARFPPGAGRRALRALAALGVLASLAWLLLPVTHAADGATRRWMAWHRGLRRVPRVLLFPVELLAAGSSGLARTAFFAAALLVVAASLTTLLAGVWILAPDFLGGYEHWAGRLAGLLPGAR